MRSVHPPSAVKCAIYTAFQVPKRFEGGSAAFFNLIYSSFIPDFASLREHISYDLTWDFDPALQQATGFSSMYLHNLVEDFLKGSGIPCPNKFAELRGSFSPAVDLSAIDTPGFRPRIFAWAVGGQPLCDPSNTANYQVSSTYIFPILSSQAYTSAVSDNRRR